MQAASPIIAAVLTVAGGMLVVWWQMHGMTADNRAVLERLTSAIQNSSELRKAVRWPLEGRWDYELQWESYFNVSSDPSNKSSQFFSKGLADIQLKSNQYQFLIGYENSVRDGRKLVTGVSTGFCDASEDGIPSPGSTINMGYSHRLGVSDALIGDQRIDFSKTPESRYEFIITDYEFDQSGVITVMHARFAVDQSRGNVKFTRQF